MNDIYKCSSRAFFVAFLQICLALTTFSCDSDTLTTKIEEEECEIGETVSCDTKFGNTGVKVCLPEGVYTECVYLIPKAGRPCEDLGEEYACACDGVLTGHMYCLKDGTDQIYSECFCESSPTSSPIAAAGSGGEETTADDSGGACPSPFSCQEIPQGGVVNKLCADKSQIPPFCESKPDCAAAGLEAAQCIYIAAGVKVCLQACD